MVDPLVDDGDLEPLALPELQCERKLTLGCRDTTERGGGAATAALFAPLGQLEVFPAQPTLLGGTEREDGATSHARDLVLLRLRASIHRGRLAAPLTVLARIHVDGVAHVLCFECSWRCKRFL